MRLVNMDKKESNIHALLDTKWEPSEDDSCIKGTWAEDGSEYVIRVPAQLRQSLLLMQNKIFDKKQRLIQARTALLNAERDFNNTLGVD